MKYLISVGHTASGNVGCGAVGYLNESNCTREIVPLIVSKLKSLGHEAIKLQIDNSDSHDYVKRANQANSIGGDMFIEIHLNAGGGTGCEALTTPNSSASNVGYNISKAIANSLGITNRGHKTTTGLYVLNHTSMPAVLVEVCFVDNKTDYNAYNADKIANAIVSGLTGQQIVSNSDKCYIVTDYLKQAYEGYDGVCISDIVNLIGVKCYARHNSKGIWLESSYITRAQAEEIKKNLGNLFYSINE